MSSINLNSSAGHEVTDGTSTINWAGDIIENVTSGSADDLIFGNASNNTLAGGGGYDTYMYAAVWGNDSIIDSGINYIYFTSGTNNITVNLNASTGHELTDGTSTINWASGAITDISTRSGNDLIYGDANNNWFMGRSGNDTIFGGAGSDTYYFISGFGADIVDDSAGAADVIDLTSFASSAVVSWTAVDSADADSNVDELLIDFGSGNTIRIRNYFNNTSTSSTASGQGAGLIESIQFSDGTRNFSDVQTLTNSIINGTAAADFLQGTAIAESIAGLAGNDTIEGLAGNDTLDGGADNDEYLYATTGWGNDTIIDSGGTDFVNVTVSSNVTINLTSSAGDELSDGTNTANWAGSIIERASGGSGNDLIYGSANGDTLNGRAGNDTLSGLAGTDTYVFENAWGQDTIIDPDWWYLSFTTSNNLTINLNVSTGHEVTDGTNTINWSLQDAHDVQVGGNGNDIIYAFANNGFFYMGSGNDTIVGNTSGDSMYGEAGDDVYRFVSNAWGSDSIADTSGTDTVDFTGVSNALTINLVSSTGNEVQGASTGTVNWAGSVIERVIAGSGADLIYGNTANETLDGAGGNDTFFFNASWGNDSIIDGSGTDTFQVNSSYANNLTINLTSGTGNEVTDGTNTANWASNAIENAVGGAGNDLITGNTGANSISGGSGNDTLNGNTGNDTLDGGAGIDTYEFNSGWGTDTVIDSTSNNALNAGLGNTNNMTLNLNTGTGHELTDGTNTVNWSGAIFEYANTGDGHDVFFGDANANHYSAYQGNDTITAGGGNDTTDGGAGNDVYSYANNWGADSVIDSSGWDIVTLTSATVNLTANLTSSSGNEVTDGAGNTINWASDVIDQVDAGTGNDLLFGSSAANTLKGNNGNDTLNGLGGNDTLEGGAGSDTYQFSGTWGADTIIETGSDSDTVDFSSISNAITVNLVSSGSHEATDGTNTLNWASDLIENVIGGSGADVLYGNTGANTLNGGNGNDSLFGGAGNDRLEGGAGDNYLNGGSGNDTLVGGANSDYFVFDSGWGADTIISSNYPMIAFTTSSNLTINFSVSGGHEVTDGTNTLNWDTGVSVKEAYGGSGNDWIIQTSGAYGWMEGGQGNDTLQGGAGTQDLVGNEGNDNLDGGDGDDRYYFYATGGSFGADTIIDSGGSDRVDLNAYSPITNNLTINLNSGTGHEVTDGTNTINWASDCIENVVSGAGNDILSGSNVANSLAGSSGNDTIEGAGGNDSLDGGAGNDSFIFQGSWGADTLIDSAGTETLDFSTQSSNLTVNLVSSGGNEVSDGTNTVNWAGDVIENVTSGSGNDDIHTNGSNN